MNNKSNISQIDYYEQELDDMIAEAIEKFAQCNIRFRTPNRNLRNAYPMKLPKTERECV